MTLSGCGNCLALGQAEWVQGELFVFPSKNKEGFGVSASCRFKFLTNFSITGMSYLT